MRGIRVRALTVKRGDETILRDLDLVVPSGSSLAILGASGSGKTTLLRTIVGFEQPDIGNVYVGDIDVTHASVAERGVSLVAQDPALQPNINLARNVERPLRYQTSEQAAQREAEVERQLTRFGLTGKGHQRPHESSAGEQQAAAAARGTAAGPSVLLLDEPITAVDAPTRRELIRRIREATELTTLVVATNDWAVAASLADEVAVLVDGAIAQVGTHADVYGGPSTIEIASLTGEWPLNRLSAQVEPIPGERTRLLTPAGTLHTWKPIPRRALMVAVRPEDLTVKQQPTRDDGLTGTVTHVAPLGRISMVSFDADGLPLRATAPHPAPKVGDQITARPTRVHLFGYDGVAIDHLDLPTA